MNPSLVHPITSETVRGNTLHTGRQKKKNSRGQQEFVKKNKRVNVTEPGDDPFHSSTIKGNTSPKRYTEIKPHRRERDYVKALHREV